MKMEGYSLLKTRGLQECVLCKCGESANSLLFSGMHEIHGKHTAMQRWGILESSQKCFFVVQALINNYVYKVNAYDSHYLHDINNTKTARLQGKSQERVRCLIS